MEKDKGAKRPIETGAHLDAGKLANPVLPASADVKVKKEKKKKLPQGPQKLDLLIKHEFTDRELLDLGDLLGRENQNGAELESQKKTIMSDYKSKIDGVKANVQEISNKIGTKYEMRSETCLVHFDFKNRKKFIFKHSDGKFVRREEFSVADNQATMSFLPEFPKGYVLGNNLPKSYVEKIHKAEEAAKAKK